MTKMSPTQNSLAFRQFYSFGPGGDVIVVYMWLYGEWNPVLRILPPWCE